MPCRMSYFVFKFLGGSQRQNWLQSVLWPTVGSHRLKTKPKRIAGGTVVPKGSNPPKKGSLDVISRVFQINSQHFDFHFRLLHALHIQNLSNCYKDKYNQSISRIFGEFLLLSLTVRRPRKKNMATCVFQARDCIWTHSSLFLLFCNANQNIVKAVICFQIVVDFMVDGWKSCIVSAKSFKIAIPGIWTLNGKICSMIYIDPENLMRSFLPGIWYFIPVLFSLDKK